MSYIDTFDNEFVGYFGGIAVYRPLEVVPAHPDDPQDFGCGPENLVIGGGRGEHPGIVVKAPGEAVVCFVRAWLRRIPFCPRTYGRPLGQPSRPGRMPTFDEQKATCSGAHGGTSWSSRAGELRTMWNSPPGANLGLSIGRSILARTTLSNSGWRRRSASSSSSRCRNWPRMLSSGWVTCGSTSPAISTRTSSSCRRGMPSGGGGR